MGERGTPCFNGVSASNTRRPLKNGWRKRRLNSRRPLKSNLPAVRPGNCFCGVPGRPRRPLTSATGCGPPSCSRLSKAKRGYKMTDYYAYFTGDDGHITSRVTILAANDEEAKERAKQLVDGHAVELWQEGRKVAQFD